MVDIIRREDLRDPDLVWFLAGIIGFLCGSVIVIFSAVFNEDIMKNVATNFIPTWAYELSQSFFGIIFMVCAIHTLLIVFLLVDEQEGEFDNNPLPKIKLDSAGIEEDSPSLVEPCHSVVKDIIPEVATYHTIAILYAFCSIFLYAVC